MEKEKQRGYTEEIISADEDVVITRWLDNKAVDLASNFVGIGEPGKV